MFYAQKEAERFLAAITKWRKKNWNNLKQKEQIELMKGNYTSGAECAAVKRASLDLTKALSAMRHNK